MTGPHYERKLDPALASSNVYVGTAGQIFRSPAEAETRIMGRCAQRGGDLAMWQAVLALVGVVLGGAIAGGVTLRQLRLITDREHEARQAERELARQDARREFQRNTILAIQDAVADLLRMVVYLHDEAVNAEEKTGHWPAPRRFDELPASFDEHFACVQGLRARVFDEELRRLVADLSISTLKAIHAGDRERAARLMVVLTDTNKQVQERVHSLLKESF